MGIWAVVENMLQQFAHQFSAQWPREVSTKEKYPKIWQSRILNNQGIWMFPSHFDPISMKKKFWWTVKESGEVKDVFLASTAGVVLESWSIGTFRDDGQICWKLHEIFFSRSMWGSSRYGLLKFVIAYGLVFDNVRYTSAETACQVNVRVWRAIPILWCWKSLKEECKLVT